MPSKELFATLALIIGFAAFVPYLWSAIKGHTKPHAFSWIIWGVISTVAAVGQFARGAGPGAWPTTAGALFCFFLAFMGWRYGMRRVTRGDWLVLVLALLSIPLWVITQDPLWSMILLSIINASGLYSTFRKAYSFPREERAILYCGNIAKFGLGLCAMDNYTLVTLLFPVSVMANNLALVIFLAWRRTIVPLNQLSFVHSELCDELEAQPL